MDPDRMGEGVPCNDLLCGCGGETKGRSVARWSRMSLMRKIGTKAQRRYQVVSGLLYRSSILLVHQEHQGHASLEKVATPFLQTIPITVI